MRVGEGKATLDDKYRRHHLSNKKRIFQIGSVVEAGLRLENFRPNFFKYIDNNNNKRIHHNLHENFVFHSIIELLILHIFSPLCSVG